MRHLSGRRRLASLDLDRRRFPDLHRLTRLRVNDLRLSGEDRLLLGLA